ncbi:MAG: hypothetical protein K2X86_15375 [Cytophagaceae bacterium]|nr:hypothetical protein [Cytophagaceae bacterium]
MKKICFLLVLTGVIIGVPYIGHTNSISPLKNISEIFSDLIIDIEKKDASGTDKKDGEIRIKITGGQAPYSISLFSTTIKAQKFEGNEVNIDNLSSGTYLFIIQDSNKEIKQESVTILTRQ